MSHFKYFLLKFITNSFGQVLRGNGEQVGNCPPDGSPSSTTIAGSLLLALFPKKSIITLPVVTYCPVFNHLFLPLHSCVYILTVGTYLVSVKLEALLLYFSWWRKTNQIILLPSFLHSPHIRRLKIFLFPLELVIQLMS